MRRRWLFYVMMLPLHAATVGDPNTPAALLPALIEAHDHGANDLTIAPGIYDIPSRDHQDTLMFKEWKDVTIHADGVTLIFEELKRRPVYFVRCHNVTWDGGTLRFARPAFTQGRIVTTGVDEKGKYCDWRIDAGYPNELQAKTIFNIVDGTTRRLKVGTMDWYPEPREPTSPGLFRFHYTKDPHFAVNDWLVARSDGGNQMIIHEGCEGCTTSHVTLQNAGFGAFFDIGGAGGNRYLGCTIEPGPRPAGATEDELVGGGADGLHSVDNITGPDIEDCVFRGVFLDDCIAIHGTLNQVTESQGNRVLLNGNRLHPAVGETLRFASMNGYFAEAKVTAVEPKDERAYWVTLDQNLNVPIDPSGATDPHKGTQASNPRACGAGYKILRCQMGDTRSRGILVKGDNGVIDHCTIDGCGMSGVSIGPEFWWGEAGYSWHVVVSNNTLLHCAQNNADSVTLYLHGDGAIGNRDVTITNNTFDGCYGDVMIGASYSDGVEITGNRFDHPSPLPLPGARHIIYLSQCRNVKLAGNVVTNQSPGAGRPVQFDLSMKATDVVGDDDSGIKVSASDAAMPK